MSERWRRGKDEGGEIKKKKEERGVAKNMVTKKRGRYCRLEGIKEKKYEEGKKERKGKKKKGKMKAER